MTQIEALEYVLERLTHEASIRPAEQNKEALDRKLAAIEALVALRAGLQP